MVFVQILDSTVVTVSGESVTGPLSFYCGSASVGLGPTTMDVGTYIVVDGNAHLQSTLNPAVEGVAFPCLSLLFVLGIFWARSFFA